MTDYDRIRAEHIREYGEGTRHLAFLNRLYPDRTHFIFELLQNAEDAGATFVSFELFKDRFEMRHDGRPFDERDVRAICGVDAGTKANDLTQIGKFGIGFKSVYAYTSDPEVHCDGEHFRIEAYVRPFATAARPTAVGETLFVLPFSRPDVSPGDAYREIGDRLAQLEPTTLLFLRHIRTIRWHIADGMSGSIEREETTLDGGRRVRLSCTSGSSPARAEHWIVYSRHKEVTLCGQRTRIRWVEVAFRLDGGSLAQVVPIEGARLAVFFLTDKETHLGFIVQGPFKTTPARDNVPADDPWNRSLVEELADLVVEVLPRMRDEGLGGVRLLQTLPVRAADFPIGSMLRPLFEGVRRVLQQKPLLPAHGGGWVSAAEARIAASRALRDLLSPAQLRQMFRSEHDLSWLSSEIGAEDTPDLYHYLRWQLGIPEIDATAVALRCDEGFLAAQSDEWLIDFYAFLSAHPVLWRAGGGPWNTEEGIVRRRPILRLENGTHVVPFRDDGSPAAYLPPREPTMYPVIRASLAADPRAREFLMRLGLHEPDVVTEVIERVLPLYSPAAMPPSDEQHVQHIEKIVRALATDSLRQRERLIARLRDTAFLRCRSATGETVAYRKPEAAYVRRPELETYFAGDLNAWWVDESIEPPPETGGWTLIGVGSTPRRIAGDLALTVDEKRALRSGHPVGWTADLDVVDYELDGLSNFLARFDGAGHVLRRKALALWTLLAEAALAFSETHAEHFFSARYRWEYHGREAAVYFPASFARRLRDVAWLPRRSGGFARPPDISLSDLPDEFARAEAVAAGLGMGLGEIDDFARRHGIAPDLLKFTVEHPEAVEDLRRRRMLFPDLDEEEKTEFFLPAGPVNFAAELDAAFATRTSEAVAEESSDQGGSGPARPTMWFARVPRSVWNLRESAVRTFLIKEYGGHCQVCEQTFRTRMGEPYCEGLYLVPAARARWPNHPGNALLLCPTCCAKFIHGAVEAPDFRRQVLDASNDGALRIALRLCGEPVFLRFTAEHATRLRDLLTRGVAN